MQIATSLSRESGVGVMSNLGCSKTVSSIPPVGFDPGHESQQITGVRICRLCPGDLSAKTRSIFISLVLHWYGSTEGKYVPDALRTGTLRGAVFRFLENRQTKSLGILLASDRKRLR